MPDVLLVLVNLESIMPVNKQVTLPKNTFMKTLIPLQLADEGAAQGAADAVSTSSKGLIATSFLFNLILSYSLNQLVSAVNTMQLLTHSNLMEIKQPAISN